MHRKGECVTNSEVVLGEQGRLRDKRTSVGIIENWGAAGGGGRTFPKSLNYKKSREHQKTTQ